VIVNHRTEVIFHSGDSGWRNTDDGTDNG